MIAVGTQFRVLIICALSSSCATRSGPDFRILPATPNYLLRNPDSEQTPFPEILRVYNGFEPGGAWLELRPYMELRIENAYYEPGASKGGLTGFLGTEVAQYKMRLHVDLQLLSVRSMQHRPDEQTPVQQLIPRSQQRHRYFRFYYEVLFRRSGRSRGSVLLSANAKDGIDELAAELERDADSVCSERSTNCTVFPEACSVSIEMEVVVNGSPINLIWGSVLSNIVDHPQHLELWRIYHGRLTQVKLDAKDTSALRLPLLPGDHVRWR
jgi:hypothetical protein